LTWQYVFNPKQRNQRISINDVRRVMKNAMKVWTDVTNIEFTETRKAFTNGGKDEPDILVKFLSDTLGDHRRVDHYPFDGKGGMLAYAFYPLNNKGLAGDIHFDDDEDFTINGARPGYEVDLQWVATHELGHSLGLDHSSDQNDIMFPYYSGYKKDIKLSYDDKFGIQKLYGGPMKGKPSS